MAKKYREPVRFEVGGKKTRYAVMLLYLSTFFAAFDVSLYLVWPDRLSASTGSYIILVTIPGSLSAVGATIAFLFWFYRAYKNVTLFPADGRRFSPGWTIAGSLVPLLDLVAPYLIVREIWKVSTPGLDIKDIFAWRRASAASFISVWWSFHIVSTVVVLVGTMTLSIWRVLLRHKVISQDIPVNQLAGILAIGGILNLVSLLLKVRVINGIDTRQAVRYRELDQPDDPQGSMIGRANLG